MARSRRRKTSGFGGEFPRRALLVFAALGLFVVAIQADFHNAFGQMLMGMIKPTGSTNAGEVYRQIEAERAGRG